jgi:hypothetical protein
MLKKTIVYNDFDGKERSEQFLFNLTEAEVVRLDSEFPGGLASHIENLDVEGNPHEVIFLFERLIKSSYGIKSDDGRHFIKNDPDVDMFWESAAYSALFMELVKDAEKAASFFNALISVTHIDKK